MIDADSLWLATIPYEMHELISRKFELISGGLISRELILWELISRELISRELISRDDPGQSKIIKAQGMNTKHTPSF